MKLKKNEKSLAKLSNMSYNNTCTVAKAIGIT